MAVILPLMLLLSTCTNRQIYNAVQQNQQLECSKLPQARFEQCMQEVNESYDTYQAQRNELVNKGEQ